MGGERLNKRIKRYLNEIEKTEKKIVELQQYLKGVRAALKEEENNEMIKSIRGMKLNSQELFELLNRIQDGSIQFQAYKQAQELAIKEVQPQTYESEEQYHGENEGNE